MSKEKIPKHLPNTIDIELICLKEFIFLFKRNLRYFYFILSMYGRLIVDQKNDRLLRATYCLARFIDDVIDGDRLIKENPKVYIRDLIYQIESGTFDLSAPISRLACFVVAEFNTKFKSQNNVKQKFLNLINIMLLDLERADKKLILTSDELDNHLYRTFELAVDITLIISRANLSANEIPNLLKAQSCFYTLRDLKKDLSMNIINIPREVLMKAKQQGAASLSYNDLNSTSVIQQWQRNEFKRGEAFLSEFLIQLKMLKDRRAKMVLKPLAKGLKLFAWKNRKTFLG